MFDMSACIYYSSLLLITVIPAICAAYGQGSSSQAAFDAQHIQPSAHEDISSLLVVSNALTETAPVLGFIISIILLSSQPTNLYESLSYLGIVCAFAITGGLVAYTSSRPPRAAFYAIARQPFFAKKIHLYTLIMQSIMQTPVLMGFLIALGIKNQIISTLSLYDSLRLISAGLALGIGSIGPVIGLGNFLTEACVSLGINRHSYSKILSFSFFNDAMIGASLIFALLISFSLLATSITTLSAAYSCLGAALCIGLGTLGVGISLGAIAKKGTSVLRINPSFHAILNKTSLVAQALVEAQTIYAFIIALRILKSAT